MKQNSDILKISEITKNIYLSGVFSLDNDPSLIRKNNIKYILSCVNKQYVSDIHNKIMAQNPNVMILYLPYDDDIEQNLWAPNKDMIEIVAYTNTNNNYDRISSMMNLYKNKPLIEIGYHFMNIVISNNEKVLVHCMAGVSRSVSLVIYYLMKKHRMTFNQSFSYVKNIRSIANPNDSFKAQLLGYESKRYLFTEKEANKRIRNSRTKSSISELDRL